MSIGPQSDIADGYAGSYHEALRYGSDAELLDTVVPFLRAGLAAGEPAVVAWPRAKERLLREVMSDDEGVLFLDDAATYTRPSSVVKSYRSMLAEYVAAGVDRVRVTGQFPAYLLDTDWWWWARYESVANHIYTDFPVWTLCAYDTRTSPARVLDDVARTHPRLATASGGHLRNDRYQPMDEFLSGHTVPPDPIEATRPIVDLLDRTEADARHAIWAAHRAGRLPRGMDVDAAVLIASEAVSNGIRHGEPPIHVRLWADPYRAVIAVHDQGAGPAIVDVGLRPVAHGGPGGRGLWLIHELADHVSLEQRAGGYTLRATLRPTPTPAPNRSN